MPVSILTPSQRHRYGRFRGEPTSEQLAKQSYQAPAEIAIVMVRRQHAWQQMGNAIQLMTVRFLGNFLEQGEAVQVPRTLIAFAAQQLQLTHIPDLTPYANALDLIKVYRLDIWERFAYADFNDVRSAFEAWLHVRVLRSGHSPLELFDLSTAWCFEHQVILPVATTLERTVASVHDQALSGMWCEISALIRRGGHVRPLLALLTVSPETGRNGIDELQREPKRQSSIGMQDSERRVERFQQIGVSDLDLSPWPAARIREMAEHAVLTKRGGFTNRVILVTAHARFHSAEANMGCLISRPQHSWPNPELARCCGIAFIFLCEVRFSIRYQTLLHVSQIDLIRASNQTQTHNKISSHYPDQP